MNYSVLDAIPQSGGEFQNQQNEPPEDDNYHEDIPGIQEEFESEHGDHLAIWNKCCTPPQSALKPFKRSGGFPGTDINPEWRILKMTEMFGPVGTGWGWKIHDRWSEDFASGKFAFVVCSVWFILHGKPSWTGEQIGGTEAGRTPDEAYKMAVTDAIGKCMAAIGVAGDIYLGLFDTKYQRAEAAPQQSYQPAPQPANAYSEPIQRPVQQQAYQQPVQQQSGGDGSWRSVPVHFGKNEGVALGSLKPYSLLWYQEKWLPGCAGKKLSPDDITLYNAVLASLGRLSLGAPKEVPF